MSVKITRQEVAFVPSTRKLDLKQKPKRVWTIISDSNEDPNVVPELPYTPVHNVNAFMEDYLHDWDWRGGTFHYYSRVALSNIWILIEYV